MHVACEIVPALVTVGLPNDAVEAYRDDVPSPLQAQLPLFKGFEWKIEQAIGERFGVDLELISS